MTMKTPAIRLAAVAALLLIGTAANATLLTTISHDYGTGPGQVSTPSLGAGTCDTLNSDSITITNSSGCQRFFDVFDFSGVAYDSISGFELTLTYSDARAGFWGLQPWRVRPASSPTEAVTLTSEQPSLGSSNDLVTNTFAFEPSLSIFDDILAGEAFYLWFNATAGGAQSFNLFSADLAIFGEPATSAVPTPATLALLLGGLGLLGAFRRRPRV
ncbi:MAG: hypothetical protein JJT88_08005 [Gammaproteobacteria bacterium]|nr:hypothetical protein [Gammaproteobacteria bacterium]